MMPNGAAPPCASCWLIPPFPPIYAAACKLYPDDAQWGSTTMRLMLAYFVCDSLVVPFMTRVRLPSENDLVWGMVNLWAENTNWYMIFHSTG